MVISTLALRWFGDQLLGNAVTVRQGINGEVFVKLPDGSFNPPPGNFARLSQNADSSYSYETVNRARLDFNSAGKLASATFKNGVQTRSLSGLGLGPRRGPSRGARLDAGEAV